MKTATTTWLFAGVAIGAVLLTGCGRVLCSLALAHRVRSVATATASVTRASTDDVLSDGTVGVEYAFAYDGHTYAGTDTVSFRLVAEAYAFAARNETQVWFDVDEPQNSAVSGPFRIYGTLLVATAFVACTLSLALLLALVAGARCCARHIESPPPSPPLSLPPSPTPLDTSDGDGAAATAATRRRQQQQSSPSGAAASTRSSSASDADESAEAMQMMA